MEIRHVRHFLAVASTLSYTRAAEQLHMSSSPLSRSIQQLERELGGALFVRGTRRVELTPLGLSAVPRATRILADVDELVRDTRRRARGHVELTIGIRSVPPELVRALVDDVVHGAEPDAEVNLAPLDSFAQLDLVLGGGLALGLVSRRSDDARLRYLAVLRETAGMALPDQPRYRGLTEVGPDDVTGLRLLTQPGSDPRDPQLADYLAAVQEVAPVTTDIVGGIAALVAEGGCCCLTVANRTAPWHRYLLADGVVIRPLPTGFARATTYLCWRADRDDDEDLGPVLRAARSRFAEPLEL